MRYNKIVCCDDSEMILKAKGLRVAAALAECSFFLWGAGGVALHHRRAGTVPGASPAGFLLRVKTLWS